MTFSFRAASGAAAAASSLTITEPSGVQNGDLLVAAIWWSGTTGFTSAGAPSGWTVWRTATPSTSPTQAALVCYWRVASSEPGSVAFSATVSGSGTATGVMSAYTPPTATPFDRDGAATATSGATLTAPAITTTAAHDLLLLPVAVYFGASGKTISPPAGFTTPSGATQASTSGNSVVILAHNLDAGAAGSTGSQAATLSSGVNSTYGAAIDLAGFFLGTSGPPPPFPPQSQTVWRM